MNSRRAMVGTFLLIALALITLDFRSNTGPVGAVQRVSDSVFAPVQGGFAAIVRPVGDFFGSIFEIGSLRGRIERLEADNEQLRNDLAVQADLERRLREAEELLNMSAQQQVTLVGARVIATPPGTFERSVVIDVGAAQGIGEEMAVINSRGVVGLVVEVTANRARVSLLSSTESGLGVRIAQTSDRGLLRGQGSGLLQLEMLDPDPEVPLDAVIVTQSFQGSRVPGGLQVGALEPPPDGDPAGERFLEVRPYVDFSSLSTVAVVVAGREEEGEFGEDEVIDAPNLEPAPQVTVQPNDSQAVPGEDFPLPATPAPSEGASPGVPVPGASVPTPTPSLGGG